jgi:hypothetical protein
MSEWSFNTSEYTPEERAEAGSYDYGLLPKGTYKARVGMVRWRYWDDGGKTLKVFFNIIDPNYPNNCFVWDCSLVNKRNAQAQSKAHDLFYQLCKVANIDEVQESKVDFPVGAGGVSGAECMIKLVVLEPSAKFPSHKNWLVGFKSPEPDYHGVSEAKMAKQAAVYDDDHVPF